MSDDEFRFFSLRRLPARLTVEEVAWFLRCRPEDVQALARSRLLKPLGNPPPNGKKVYRTKDILECADDTMWLTKMTNALYKRWRDKNASRNGEGGLRVAS